MRTTFITGLVFLLTPTAWGQCFTTNDDAGPAMDSNACGRLRTGSSEFALKLFGNIQKNYTGTTDNVILSPISIWAVLTATWHGTRGQTKRQIENILRYGDRNQKRINGLYHDLIDQLQHSAKEWDNYTLRLANKVYFDQTIELRDCIVHYLRSDIERQSFSGDAEAAHNAINRWVEEQTNNMITQLLPAGIINTMTRMVLVNAIYFKGYWATPFINEYTNPADFFLESEEAVTVDTMFRDGYYEMADIPELQCSAIKLRYLGGDVHMIVLLPDRDTRVGDLVSRLSISVLENINSRLTEMRVMLWMPKFQVEQSLELKDHLRDLGITDLFDPRKADLFGFSNDGVGYIAFVRHKTRIDVTESGTEAAGATAAVAQFFSLPPLFRINRPFVFLIQHTKLDSILFLGTVRDPRPKAA